jgi:hypothetical protein
MVPNFIGFFALLGGPYVKRRKKRGILGIQKAFSTGTFRRRSGLGGAGAQFLGRPGE